MMNNGLRNLLGLMAGILFSGSVMAQGCVVSAERQVVDRFMALDPSGALSQVERLALNDPGNPAYDLYRGMAVMVRAFRDDAVDEARRPYDDEALRHFEVAAEKAQRRVNAAPDDTSARFVLGAAQSYQAGLLEARGKRLKALKLVHKGRDALQQLVAEHSDMEEAYMVLGLFEYMLGNNQEEHGISARLLNLTGDPDLGLSYLERSVENAANVAPEAARILLMDTNLSETEMCRYGDLAVQMYNRYPGNKIFSLLAEIVPLQCRLAEKEGLAVSPSAGIVLHNGCNG